MITFALFVWFTMKFVWPPISKALDEREDKISGGLQAAERGQRQLELAEAKVTETLKEAKVQAASILDGAKHQSIKMVEEAKAQAKAEGDRQLKLAKEQLHQEINSAKEALRKQVATLAIQGAEKIIEREVDEASNQSLVDKLIQEL
jgi:F-type H+-transporting ATPase subunit b